MTQKSALTPAQDTASNPTENVWVQANAGTGKTWVLVRRLLRILFRTESINTSGILCLTYTNAGAGEMRNRILSALREWAMKSDDELVEMLHGIALNPVPNAADVAHAREIFFTYIDNPDILKIKTIHGFCEEILHRFPIEAGISPSWSLVFDAAQRVLLQDAFQRLIKSSGDVRTNDAFAYIVGRISETSMGELLKTLSEQYKHFFDVENLDNYRKYFVDTTKQFLQLNVPIQTEIDAAALQKIIDLTEIDIKSTKKPAKYMFDIVNKTKQFIDNTIDFDEYKTAYLTSTGTPQKSVSKKEYLTAEQKRVYELNQYYANQTIFNDTVALFDLAASFARIYRDLKHERNLLDFEDMILYTRRLFAQPETMGWVLSQLNISLSHILVDEAQDTSPVQWDILRMLSGDFFADGDTAAHQHSLFVVGDTKQSIYGFQGADPNAFATSRAEIAAQISNNMRTIREVPLDQSFRSLGAILHAVDKFFDDKTVVEISGFANNAHKCFRTESSGLVELHKLVSKQDDETDVSDYVRAIADKIKSLIDSGEYAPHDIMVLVQNRVPMAAPLVAELKRRNIDVAGSDRIVLPDFPAIRDLLNVVRFCLNTRDNYSLCCILKSPIFRLNEADIFNICKIKNAENKLKKLDDGADGATTVFAVLAKTHSDVYTRLCDIIEWSQKMSPYTFFTTVLSNGVRQSMIAALGAQIIDPLEEFLTICLAYERTMPGTLRHFLKWFVTGDSEIKRDMDASSGVRVMTVHGSKGLDARAVFLIDTVRIPKNEHILPLPVRTGAVPFPAPWLWTPRSNNVSAACADVSDAVKKNKMAEYYRLLYVAMTRARDALFIYGFEPRKNAPDNSWHTQLWRVFAGDDNTAETIRITE